MRRALFTVVASAAVFAFVPATALASKHHRRHHHHHTRVHHRRHARIHKFGSFTAPRSQGTPMTPPPTDQTAGTVTSFDATTGKLVITLADGTTTETGMVTGDTEIECQAMDNNDGGDSVHLDGDGGSSGGGDNGDQGDDNGNDNGDDDGGDNGGQNCTTADLVPGAVLLGAELKIGSSGAVWDKIELQS
jgi:hypothetical protein